MQDGQQPQEPGRVITPGETALTDSAPTQPAPAPEAAAPAPQPTPTEQPETRPLPMSEPIPAVESLPPVSPQATESYSAADDTPADEQTVMSQDQITWTASEYIANPKSAGWFGLLALGSIILAVVVYFVTERDIVPTVVIALLGVIVGIFAARQPQTLEYKIDNTGIHIGQKLYPYASFKAFSVARDHAIGFIQLLPLRRFMPPLVIHYAPEDEDAIAEVLASYLPFEVHKPDIVDNLTRKIRF